MLDHAYTTALSRPWGGAVMENNEEDQQGVKAFLTALEVFTRERPTMPMQYARAFAYVALNEGISVRDLANKTGQSPTVMSRHLLDIGDSNRHLEPGMGLITTKIDPQDRRVHRAYLTATGRTFARKIAAPYKRRA